MECADLEMIIICDVILGNVPQALDMGAIVKPTRASVACVQDDNMVKGR